MYFIGIFGLSPDNLDCLVNNVEELDKNNLNYPINQLDANNFNISENTDLNKNNSNFDQYYYQLLWQCAQNLTYSKFYQAWHHKTMTTHSEINNNTFVGNNN